MLLVFTVSSVRAQGFRVEGVVTSAVDNTPLPAVNIVEVGTQNGTISDGEGKFALTVSGPNASLAVSFIGYVTQTVSIDGRSTIPIALQEDVGVMGEVVVTALGIEREQKALGYSVAAISGESLREARETNVANALSGKVAGVVVTKPATGPQGSSRVVIRGTASLEGDNQPLYVVDGVPIDNSNHGSAGMWGGVDQGDGISSINPDDIDNITVLKGPSAAALYGTRAQNGVILITTKSGRPMSGLGVEFNSNVTFEDALTRLEEYQTLYGQGSRGKRPQTLEEARGTIASWGERFDGQPTIQFDGVARPYAHLGPQVDQFYNTGVTATNNLALTGGFRNTTFRLSASHMGNESIVPHSGMDRYNVTLRGTSTFGERLSADAKISYVRDDVWGRARLSDSPGNANWTVSILPGNLDFKALQPGHDPNDEHKELQYSNNIWSQNPYWAAKRYVNDDKEDRFIGFTQLKYQLLSWLSVQSRVGQDLYNTRYTAVTPYGTGYAPRGNMSERDVTVMERNIDFLFVGNRRVTKTLALSGTFGGNRMDRNFETLVLSGSNFNIPGLQTISNTAQQSIGYGVSRKRINSLYGSTEFAFREYFFVTATARNDWSSTLPLENNSYFYPSVSGSFVFSDAFRMPAWLDFGKVRASWAEVGGDTDPYRLSLTYNLLGFSHQGQPTGQISQTAIPLANMKPSSSVGTEAGIELRLLNNRVGLDFTAYSQRTYNQILSTTVVESSGYSSKVINAGEMRNTGIEMLLNLSPVSGADWRWDVDFNFGKNKNEVVELTEGLKSLTLGTARSQTAWVVAEVGQPYSAIKGYAYKRDPKGNIVLDATGRPERGELKILGNGMPDWRGGLSNTLRFKNVTLNALVDISWGGHIYSGTNGAAYGNGLHKNTLAGRDVCEQVGYDANGGQGCWVPDGVVEVKDAAGNVTYQKNTKAVLPQSYYGILPGRIAEEFVYDASFIKLRELQLRYRVPARLLRGTPVQVATISLVGRNLWLIYSKVPNVDPESNYNNTNAQGLEWAGVPQTRSIGFNLNVRL